MVTDYTKRFFPESRFGGFSDIDGTMRFYSRVNALLDRSFTVLDVGCGRGAYGADPVPFRRDLRILKGKTQRTIGIDVAAAACDNPFIDEFRRIEGSRFPLDNNSVDLVLCDCVIEHLEVPKAFFAELRRVLKSGGFVCIRTPNTWSYVALFSRLIPNRLHAKVLSQVQAGREQQDVFRTYYRCNSLRRLRAVLKENGFEHAVYGYEAEPTYLSFSPIAYWLGTLHQRFVPRFLQATIFAFAKLNKE